MMKKKSILTALILLITSLICGITTQVDYGGLILEFETSKIDEIDYFTSDELARQSIIQNRILTKQKRKESFKIDGKMVIFTPLGPFVIIDSEAYSIGVPTIIDNDGLQIPLIGFFRALSIALNKDLTVIFPDGTEIGEFLVEDKKAKVENSSVIDIDGRIALPPDELAKQVDTLVIEDNSVTSDEKPSPPPPLPWLEDTMDTELQITKKWTVVIDPGHGGKDPGAVGVSGLYEKDVVLDIAKKIKKLADEQYDIIDIKLTRDKDVFLPLAERGLIAREYRGDIFISLHCNASKSSESNGSETFFLSPAKTSDARATELLENKAIEYEENSGYDPATIAEFILADFVQNEFIRESSRLASKITGNITESGKLRSRGTSQAAFYVLKDNVMPSVLVEVAFISNNDEEKKLKSDDFKDKVARAIPDGIEELIKEFAE